MDLPTPLLWTIIAALALIFGSFLNVCIARLPRHRSIVLPGSRCPRCGAVVTPRDNLPILSWLLLRGRCRACGQPISIRYPLVEFGYAALVVLGMVRFGFTPEGLAATVFCFLSLGLLVMDLETMTLPDAFTWPGVGLGLAWRVTSAWWIWPAAPSAAAGLQALLAAAGAGLLWAALLLVIRWIYYAVRHRQGLGLGDVKLAAMLGVWLGIGRAGLTFFLAVVGAAIVGLGLMVLGRVQGPDEVRKDWRSARLPLGAFLCGAGMLSLFFGNRWISFYMSFWN